MSLNLNGNGHGNGHGHKASVLVPSPPRPAANTGKDDGVTFRTPDGVALRGTLARITRFAAFFELHNPGSMLQASEVLADFEIALHGRIIYSGGAIVRGLVSTGLSVSCEVTLAEEGWSDLSAILDVRPSGQMLQEFKAFLGRWQEAYKILPEYKIIIADMHTFLSDARLWLEKAEVGIRPQPPAEQVKWQMELLQRTQPTLVSAIANLFERFEEVSRRVPDEQLAAHQAFGKRLVQPILMASPFVHRTLTKPLGYPGDYEMVGMMFRDPLDGPSLFAKMVNVYALQLPPIVAHRNRIEYLGRKLETEALRAAAQKRTLRVFNMGCGPAAEVQKFMAESELSHRVHFTLVDFNDETLAWTKRRLQEVKQKHARRTQITPVKKSVNMLIKAAARGEEIARHGQYDFVYCAGLFDYLTDNACRQLLEIFYALLAPGGLLVATNVDEHPARHQMECFLEWHLVHRGNEAMRALAPAAVAPQDMALKRDATGVNLFLELRKPDRAK